VLLQQLFPFSKISEGEARRRCSPGMEELGSTSSLSEEALVLKGKAGYPEFLEGPWRNINTPVPELVF